MSTSPRNTLFARFVEENADEIEAIRILLNRPKDWGTDASPRFAGLVDLICIILHAAREKAPLYTAKERVDLAISRVTAGRTFT